MCTQGFHADVQVSSFRSQHCAAGWLGCGARLRQNACARDALGALRRRKHVLDMCLCSKQPCARYVLGFRPDGRSMRSQGHRADVQPIFLKSQHTTVHWLRPKQGHTQYLAQQQRHRPNQRHRQTQLLHHLARSRQRWRASQGLAANLPNRTYNI